MNFEQPKKISTLPTRTSTVAPGKRLIHWIIDGFIVIAISMAINVLPFIELGGLLAFLIYPAYCIFFEFKFQKTPGKFISKTRVVDDYGQSPDIQTVILRTFARYVPFEPFSCLDSNSWGWHDRWTKTYVIEDNTIEILNRRLGISEEAGLDMIHQDDSKTGKNIVIAIVISLFILIGVFIYIGIKKMSDFSTDEITTLLSEANNEMYKNIHGKWQANDWDKYSMLDFVNDSVVVTTDKTGNEIQLYYTIGNIATLVLSDSNGNIQTYWMGLEGNELTLFEDIIDVSENRKEIKLKKVD